MGIIKCRMPKSTHAQSKRKMGAIQHLAACKEGMPRMKVVWCVSSRSRDYG